MANEQPVNSDQAWVEAHTNEYLTPEQLAMSNARFDIMSHKLDFQAAGIDPRYAELVAVKAEERAAAEYESKILEDPITRVERMLRELPASESDKTYLANVLPELQKQASLLKNVFRPRLEAMQRDNPNATIQDVMTGLKLGNQREVPNGCYIVQTNHRVANAELSLDFMLLPEAVFTSNDPENPLNRNIMHEPSKDMIMQVTRKLGVISDLESLDKLRQLPPKKYDGQPSFMNGYAENMTTNIPDMRLNALVGERDGDGRKNFIVINLGSEALMNMLNSPATI